MSSTSTLKVPSAVDDVQVVSVGKVKITKAAFVTIHAGILLATVLAFVGPYGVFISIYVLLLFSLLAYNVNCTQVGHCNTWAWILTFVYVFYVAIIIIMFFTKKDMLVKAVTQKMNSGKFRK